MMKHVAAKPFWIFFSLACCLLLSGCPDKMSNLERLIRDGDDFFNNQQYEKAAISYTKALEIAPGTAGIYVNRGNAFSMLDQTDKALADYSEAIRIDDAFAVAYANRGILRDNQKDWEGALADYRKVLELDPELAEAPSVWKRILYNAPNDSIQQRIDLLEKIEQGFEQQIPEQDETQPTKAEQPPTAAQSSPD